MIIPPSKPVLATLQAANHHSLVKWDSADFTAHTAHCMSWQRYILRPNWQTFWTFLTIEQFLFLLSWSCPISISTSTGDFLRPGHAIAEVQIRSSLSSPSSAAGGARMWTACQAADERIVWLNLFICVNTKYMWIPMNACRYDVLIYPVYMIISNYYWTNSGYTTHQDTQHAKQTLIIPNNHK